MEEDRNVAVSHLTAARHQLSETQRKVSVGRSRAEIGATESLLEAKGTATGVRQVPYIAHSHATHT